MNDLETSEADQVARYRPIRRVPLFARAAWALSGLGSAALVIAVVLVDRSEGPPDSDSSGGLAQAGARVPSTREPARAETAFVSRMASIDLPAEAVAIGSNGSAQPTRSAFVWRAAAVEGDLDSGAVARIMSMGRGEALESRLQSDFAAELALQTASVEAALREIALEYNKSVARAKQALRGSLERTLIVKSHEPSDPTYARLLELRASVPGAEGAVWGDMDPESRQEIHYVVKWSEFPDVLKLLEAQAEMVQGRSAIVRDWIGSQYNKHGLSLFRPR